MGRRVRVRAGRAAGRRNPVTGETRPPAPRQGIALAFLATLLWSTTGLFIDPLVTGYRMSPLQVSFWRTALLTLVLAPHVLRRPHALRFTRWERWYYLLYGLIGIGLFNVIWSTSVQINKAAVATALIFSAPAFVALAAWPLFGERLSVWQGGALLVDAVGCALAAGVANPATLVHSPAGLGWGLASGVAFAAYTLFGRGAARLGQRDPASILLATFATAALGLGVWGVATEGPPFLWPALDARGWLLLLSLTFGPTLGGYACFTVCLRTVPAALASLTTTLEPPVTAALAIAFLGRSLTGLQWAGVGLIVGAVLCMQGGPLVRGVRR